MNRGDISNASDAFLGPNENSLPEQFSYPVIVKPPADGSTMGVSLVRKDEEWRPALQLAREFEQERVMVEEYIDGREITVGIIGKQALPLVEIQYPGEMYDYDAKYIHEQGETLYLCPPQTVPEPVQQQAQELALQFAESTGSRDLLRVDMIVRHGDDRLFILEANNIPGFTASSLVPKAAAAAGIPFPLLCARLVQFAWQRKTE